MIRPEHIKCIGFGYQDGRVNKSWCGQHGAPFFVDPTHAALNGKNGGYLVACPECAAEITKAMTCQEDNPAMCATKAISDKQAAIIANELIPMIVADITPFLGKVIEKRLHLFAAEIMKTKNGGAA